MVCGEDECGLVVRVEFAEEFFGLLDDLVDNLDVRHVLLKEGFSYLTFAPVLRRRTLECGRYEWPVVSRPNK